MCLKVILKVYSILALFHHNLSEPMCSKYDYEEKLLTKVLRMEIKMQELDEKSKAIDVEVTHKKDSHARELEEHKANISAMIQKEMALLKNEYKDSAEVLQTIQDFKQSITDALGVIEKDVKEMPSTPVVNFQAHKPSKLSPVSGQPFVFTSVDINNGGGYSNTTGIFTAPMAGLYVFSIQVCTNNKYMYVAIVKGDVALLLTTVYDAKDSCASSSSVYTQLSAGDRVWVKCTYCDPKYEMYEQHGWAWNTFAGALVHN